MLPTTGESEKLALRAFKASNNEVVGGSGSRADETVMNLFNNKKLKK